MKWLFLFLLAPLFSLGQTIHAEKNKIVYEGKVAAGGVTKSDLNARLQQAVQVAMEKSGGEATAETPKGRLTSRGRIKLSSPYHIIRTVHFTLELNPNGGGYEYRIDSVSVTEKQRGGSEKVKDAKELLEGIEDTGLVAIETEKLLNEIDMRFQKLLAVLQNEVRANKPGQ